jgi:beta-ureidopropionase / N-carbamoyl-L-amino-acid hydrolase
VKSSVVRCIDKLIPQLTALFDHVARDSRDGKGITRDAFGPRETQAAKTLEAFAHNMGFDTTYDGGGNLHVARKGQLNDPPEIIVASHLDSVPVGGNYDGLAGVIAGIAILRALGDEGRARGNLRVIGFRGEESPWFGQAYLGSKLLLGELSHADLHTLRRFDTGCTLAEHLQQLGLELPERELRPLIPLNDVEAYFELHIEQAPLLEHLGLPVGVATAIRGNIRHPYAKCLGEYAHSGAVPRHLRHDAVIATAKVLSFSDDYWRQLINAGHDDVVFTCGIFQTDSAENTMTKVPGQVTFTTNIGSISNRVMEEMETAISRRAAELAVEHGVEFNFGSRVGTPAVDLDKSLICLADTIGREIGITPHQMPTVGHDAALFQKHGIATSVVLIRNTHGSHNPNEHMEMSDFALGASLLASVISSMG